MTLDPRDQRYASQIRLSAIGAAGQARLRAGRAVVIGVGATGSAIAEALVRAGVGHVRVVDRDVLELGNLHRQVLYDEDDLAAGEPKAEAARRRLARMNREVEVEAVVADLQPSNARALVRDAHVVLDGTDTFLTRLVLNDACLEAGTPWVYAGVVGTAVHGFPILPGQPPCFRCYVGEVPAPGTVETCETAGVLGSAVLVASGLAATEGLKLLLGHQAQAAHGLLVLDAWTRESRLLGLSPDPDCPACAGRYELLAGPGGESASLCGRDAVALRAPAADQVVDLEGLAARLAPLGALPTRNRFLVRFAPSEAPELSLTVFRDGRAIVQGTRDLAAARGLYARYVGA